MALVLEIVLGVLILASFFVAYMSAKTWRVYQVVLAEFVFLGAITFMYLGARTLATHASWRKLVATREKELAGLEQQIKEIKEGGTVDPATAQPSPKGIRQLSLQLEKLASDRGPALFDVVVAGVKDGVVQLTLPVPEHGLVPNMVLFAFDQSGPAEGGRYQGEFKVTAAAEGSPTVDVVPNLPLSEAQAKALAAAKGPWTLYTTMPIDNAALFAALDEPTRQALVPKESQAEFADANRTLRDYESFFRENFVQRSLLSDSIAELNSNIERTNAASAEADKEIAYRKAEQANLGSDLEKFQHEQRAIATYQQALEARLGELRDSLRTTFAAARQRAAQLTAEQTRAARQIDARTGAAGSR